ncbi:hypothetical protein GCM10010174_30180 [Kutzneria viridogrisea]|uniref:Membrane protein DedA with SNARE-associated domain n=1 Tax=Kutzneria viridogrisea TaxID=47990 RepID=A0ABR6BQ10_9PSEU|nr:membrane protein DedA with SNARE-associated domain [Kutzneria viridogrisea]
MSVPDTVAAALGLVFLVALVPFAPTEPVLISCGVLAASGKLPLPAVVLVASVACVLSDLINYSVGRKLGLPAMNRFRRRSAGAAVLDWTAARLASTGEPILIAARWLPAGGTIGAVLCGSLRFPLRRFLTASAIGCTLWCLYATALGYIGGTLTDDNLVLALLVSLGVGALISVPTGMALRRAQQHAPEPDPQPALQLVGS